MFAIIWRSLRDKKIFLTAYTVGGISLAWLYVLLYPSISKLSESYQQIFEQFPKAFLEAFGVSEGIFAGFESFISTEHFGFIWPLMMIFLAASYAGAALSGEIERGTVEIMLSLPVSRLKIFFGKYLAGIAGLGIFVLFSVLAIIPLAKIHNIEFVPERYFTMTLLGFMLGAAVLSVSMLMSAIFSDRSRVYIVTGGFMIGMYVIKIISALKENLANLKYFSFFYYYNAQEALTKNSISPETFAVFIVGAVAATALAAFWFSRRDVAV